jgi:hypothetical protein
LRAQLGKGGKVVKITGIKDAGRTATVLLRGSNKLALAEADRSLHDALCVVRCLAQKRYLVAGGGSPEMELTHRLSQWAKTLLVRRGGCCLTLFCSSSFVPEGPSWLLAHKHAQWGSRSALRQQTYVPPPPPHTPTHPHTHTPPCILYCLYCRAWSRTACGPLPKRWKSSPTRWPRTRGSTQSR